MLEQEKHIFDAMAVIDPILAEEEAPLKTRPLSAALIFVKYFIAEVSHGNKEDPIEEPWFAIIYHHVREWYEDTYGKAWTNGTSGITGAIRIRRIPTGFQVPKTKSKAEVEGESSWLTFPSKIDDDENPEKWLVNPPNLDRLTQAETEALAVDMVKVASCLRQITVFVNTCKSPNSEFSSLSKGILDELEAAAKSLVANTFSSIQSSIWSMQMALERALKSLSIQQRGEFLPTHDLFALYDDLSDVSASLDRNSLKKFPRWRENVSRRYSLGTDADLEKAFDLYKLTLQYIRDVTELFEREIRILNGGFLVKKPRFADLEQIKIYKHSQS
ncbi:hypothetical protein [Roseovarius sp. E0-M6]|uniref:hypothetical protein n=1 Tax=Roseovarius sp. E0-M6 TaxID=3127118 RepID=UPI00300F9074